MATFTEIVMSPVKLFRAPSPPPSPPSGGERSQEETTVAASAAKCSKKLSFDDVEERELAVEEPPRGQSLSEDAVPLLVRTSGCAESSLLVCGVEAKPAEPLSVSAPLTTQCPGNRKNALSAAVRPLATSRGSKTLAGLDLGPPEGHHTHLTNAGGRPRPSQVDSEEVRRRPATDCHSTEPLKKKKRPVEGVARPPRKKAEGHVTRPSAKTRADKKVGLEVKAAVTNGHPVVKSLATQDKVSRVLDGADVALETTFAITELPEPQHIAVVLVRPLRVTDKMLYKRKSTSFEVPAESSGAAPPPEGSRKKQKRTTNPSKSSLKSFQPEEGRRQSLISTPPDLPALVRGLDKPPLDGTEQLSHLVPRHRSKEVTVRARADKMRGRRQLQQQAGEKGGRPKGGAHSSATPPPARPRLSRSLSCPELPSLAAVSALDLVPPVMPRPSRAAASPHLASHAHRSPRRSRRHTVCSLEVERELAPLCLRKEVFPSRRSLPCPSPGHSYSTQASCFLSSPLAFLSKKAEPTPASQSLFPLAGPTSSPSIHPPSPSTWSLCKADPGGPALDR